MTPLSLFQPKESLGSALLWKGFGRSISVLVAALLATSAFAHAAPNIAGNYRGLMTQCLGSTQLTTCRNGLIEIVRLADEVDAKQAVWSQAAGGDDRAQAERTHLEYSLALDRLNQSIDAFNGDMSRSTSEAR